jgi:hypothetical protein
MQSKRIGIANLIKIQIENEVQKEENNAKDKLINICHLSVTLRRSIKDKKKKPPRSSLS